MHIYLTVRLWRHIKIFTLAIVFVCFGTASAMENIAPPRLWKATMLSQTNNSNTTLYVLGVTHFGLPFEYDLYFKNIVIPIFQNVGSLSFEGAGGREDEPLPVCDTSVLDVDGKKTLTEIRSKVLDMVTDVHEIAHRRAEKLGIHDGTSEFERKRALRTFINAQDEYSLLSLSNMYKGALLGLDEEKRDLSVSLAPLLKGSVINELIKLRPNIRIKDVDSKYGARRAYCNSGKNRIKFLVSQVSQSDSIESVAINMKVPEFQDSFSQLLLSGKLPSNSLFLELKQLDQAFICQRNREWLNDISKNNDGNSHLYALGVRHLFEVNHADAHCNGLLVDLTESGWHIELIK